MCVNTGGQQRSEKSSSSQTTGKVRVQSYEAAEFKFEASTHNQHSPVVFASFFRRGDPRMSLVTIGEVHLRACSPERLYYSGWTHLLS